MIPNPFPPFLWFSAYLLGTIYWLFLLSNYLYTFCMQRLRCWSVNGLVDVPLGSRCAPLPLLHVYRLVTEWETGDSIEARLVKSPAVHLLPDSVFMTSANVATRSRSGILLTPLPPPSSRVQPNVVQHLVAYLRRRALWRSGKMVLKSSQITNISPTAEFDRMEIDEEEDATTTQEEESDNASLFQNRELIQKHLVSGKCHVTFFRNFIICCIFSRCIMSRLSTSRIILYAPLYLEAQPMLRPPRSTA